VPLTFADFAATEGRFSKQFRKAPPETWNENMLPLAEFIDLARDEREGRFPYIWATDTKNRLTRLLVTEDLVRATEERRQFWRQIKGVAGMDRPHVDEEAIAGRVRADLIQRLSASLATIGINADAAASMAAPAPVAAHPAADTSGPQGYEPVWIETPECTACDECIFINPKIFAYNDQKQAVVINPKGGPYQDMVKAAEKCTASCIHPGTPWNPHEPGLEKLLVRAAKYN